MTTEKKIKIAHWVMIIPFAAMMVVSAISYLMKVPQVLESIVQLKYPLYLLQILAVAKLSGAVAIIYGRPRALKEWAYAGFTVNLIGAAASHAFVGDSIIKIIMPLLFLVWLMVSYYFWKRSLCFQEGSKNNK